MMRGGDLQKVKDIGVGERLINIFYMCVKLLN